MFKDREDACNRLAERLETYFKEDCIIIGIPRGGAVVAHCVAHILHKQWDIIVTRKIGAPSNKEVAIGAVSQDGYTLLNDEMINYFNIPQEYIDKEASEQVEEIKRRLVLYRRSTDFADVKGRTVILIDDGIATGYTVLAAVNSMKKQNAGKIIIAVPVASKEAINILSKHVDDIICLEMPEPFISVNLSFEVFEQNTDEEVITLFKQKSSKRFV